MSTESPQQIFSASVDAWLQPGYGFDITEKPGMTIGSTLLSLPDRLNLPSEHYKTPYRNYRLVVERAAQPDDTPVRKITLEPMDSPQASGPVLTPTTYELTGETSPVFIVKDSVNLVTGITSEVPTRYLAGEGIIVDTLGRISTGLITRQFNAPENDN